MLNTGLAGERQVAFFKKLREPFLLVCVIMTMTR